MPCGEDLKRNLRCNAMRKNIYYEMSCEKRFEKKSTMKFEKKSMRQCHTKKDLSCVPCKKNKKTMFLKFFFNSV